MGDDAEYWIEQQAEESAFKRLVNHSSGLKSLVCWLDGFENEIWSWAPGCRVSEWVYPLYKDLKVGSDFFLATSIYPNTDESTHTPARNPLRVIDDIVYEIASNDAKASFEVIIISRQELDKLKKTAERLKKQASSLKEECFAEMTGEIAAFIEDESHVETFVFHIEI